MSQEQQERLRRELYDSFKNRAMIYRTIFDELRRQFGAEKAEAILGEAIYRRGLEKGEKYAPYAPSDLAGLKEAFLAGSPDDGNMFRPEVVAESNDALDIKFHDCPLRNAWQEAGLPEEEVATLCRIAARVDNGTFESAGFEFSADTYQPNGEGCCYLHIRSSR